MHRRAGGRGRGPGGVARLGAALLAAACSPAVDPLGQRCLQALEYREPGHGDIEATETYSSPSGAGVAIRYLERAESGVDLPQLISCEFESGGRWRFTRITLRGRELSEAELALVNAEFLLRDLDRSARWQPPPPEPLAAAPVQVGAGPADEAPPAPPRFSWELPAVESWELPAVDDLLPENALRSLQPADRQL